MRAEKVLRFIIRKRGLTHSEASRKVGRNKTFFSTYFSRGSLPKIDTMALLCDKLDCDLIVRDRTDKHEWRIDPPPEA